LNYFISGTNTPNSPIDVKLETLLDRNKTEMQNIAGDTGVPTENVNLFGNFPFETPVAGESAEDVRRWHPVRFYCSKASNAC
jgi:hypothetical protein